jgi:hypothetical protein
MVFTGIPGIPDTLLVDGLLSKDAEDLAGVADRRRLPPQPSD